MTTFKALQALDTALHDKLLARLAMRWPKAATYRPDGSARVHCAHPLPDHEQVLLDTYVLAYQDAIVDILGMIDDSPNQPEPPLALREAENSVFQGGSTIRRYDKTGQKHRRKDGGHFGYLRREREKPAKDQGVRRDPAARARLEDLFKGGGRS